MKTVLRAILLVSLTPLVSSQSTLPRRTLSLEGADAVIDAALDYARRNGAPGGAIAVVDDGGNLLSFARLDGTFAAGATVSIGKARTAALFQKPTAFFEQVIVEKGRVSMTALPDFTPLQGGVPIMVDGQVVGAVGVSGAKSAQQDTEIAEFAATSIGGLASAGGAQEVSYFRKDAVAAAFQRGAPLLETDAFKIHASRRDGPGEAEMHAKDTDIFYVTAGEAVIVTGGELVGGRESGPAEILGSSIRGGEERRLAAGDVLVVPAGTPHWFREVNVPFTYYVVKTH